MKPWNHLDTERIDLLECHALFQHVAAVVAEKIVGSWSYTSKAGLAGLPAPVATAWYLWLFASEVAGNGLDEFLLNQCQSQEQIEEYYAGLKAVGATSLMRMLEDGVFLAMQEDSCLRQHAKPGFQLCERPQGKLRELGSVDTESMQLAAEPLSELVAAFLKRARINLEI